MDWARIWSYFFFASLILFGCLSIVVSIGGFFNIRSLFKDLSEAKAKAQNAAEGGDA